MVLAPTVALFFPALGLKTAAVPGFFVALLAVALLPALELLFADPDLRSEATAKRLCVQIGAARP